MLEIFANPATWVSLFALTAMEIVLGIDNLIFMSIIASRLPPDQARRARFIGLSLALAFRIALLFAVTWIIGLTQPAFTVFGHSVSWRDVILIAGGLFLLYKATAEIHEQMEGDPALNSSAASKTTTTLAGVVAQIALVDLVFSIDSIITAVGMTEHVPIMVIAVVVAVTVMLVASGPLARFIERNPTVVMLALGFLLMIGMTLIAEGFGAHVPKGYVYAAMAFSTLVEVFNMLSRRAKRRREQAAPRQAGAGTQRSEGGVASSA